MIWKTSLEAKSFEINLTSLNIFKRILKIGYTGTVTRAKDIAEDIASMEIETVDKKQPKKKGNWL